MSRRKQKEEKKAPAQGPPKDFCGWWEPSSVDEISKAHIGGHPEAERVWARPENNGRFTRRTYGISAKVAWSDPIFRAEYNAWVTNDRPARAKPFISMALSLAQQGKEWAKIKGVLGTGIKAMPKVTPQELEAEKRRMGLPHRMIEPVDEQDSNGAIEF